MIDCLSHICSQSIFLCFSSSSLRRSSIKKIISFFELFFSMNLVSKNFRPKSILFTSPLEAKCTRGISSINISKSSRCGPRSVFLSNISFFWFSCRYFLKYTSGQDISVLEIYLNSMSFIFQKKKLLRLHIFSQKKSCIFFLYLYISLASDIYFSSQNASSEVLDFHSEIFLSSLFRDVSIFLYSQSNLA